MNGGRRSMIAGVVLIVAAIVIFWASTRKTLSTTARGFLEGQGSLAVPAGLAAIAYGARSEARAKARRSRGPTRRSDTGEAVKKPDANNPQEPK